MNRFIIHLRLCTTSSRFSKICSESGVLLRCYKKRRTRADPEGLTKYLINFVNQTSVCCYLSYIESKRINGIKRSLNHTIETSTIMMLPAFFFVSCWSLVLGFKAPTSTQVTEIKSALVSHFKKNSTYLPTAVRLGKFLYWQPCVLYMRISRVLPLAAFHDCIGSGCNGCINGTNPENAGLSEYVKEAEGLYADYSSVMSRADFWYLAAIAAIEQGINFNNRRCELGNAK